MGKKQVKRDSKGRFAGIPGKKKNIKYGPSNEFNYGYFPGNPDDFDSRLSNLEMQVKNQQKTLNEACKFILELREQVATIRESYTNQENKIKVLFAALDVQKQQLLGILNREKEFMDFILKDAPERPDPRPPFITDSIGNTPFPWPR